MDDITVSDNKPKSTKHRNSPITGDARYKFEDEDDKKSFNRRILNEILEVQRKDIVKSDEEAERRISEYFITCAERGSKPCVEELALALGTTRSTLWDWETGRNHSISSDIIKRAKEIMATYDAKAVIENKINPVLYFFRAKNYYGMKDQQEYVVTPNTENMSKETILDEADLLPD